MFSARIDDDLELRLFELRHAEKLHELVEVNRAHLGRWFPWVANEKSVEDSERFIRGGLEQFAGNNGFQAGIWYRGELAGAVGLHYINWQTGRTEIGYWLAEPMQGKGIMTRVCRHLCTYLFEELGLNRVEIRCASDNHRSRAIPERLGFTQEGVLRGAEKTAEGLRDQLVYSMLAHEWRAKNS